MSMIEQKVSKAKVGLVVEQPFIATLVCGLQIEIVPNLWPPTLSTNGEVIKVHPDWVSTHAPDELMWALGHETMHCVFKHFLMSHIGARNPEKWNLAADVIINVLLEGGPPSPTAKSTDRVGRRPKGVIWDASPQLGFKTAMELYVAGKTTEGVYALLPDPPEGGWGGKGGQPGGGGAWDMVESLKGDPAVQAQADAQWSVRVAQAANAAKACGKLGVEMQRFVIEALKPKVNWKEQLRHFITKRARVDHSFARPNRRFMCQGLYLAGRSGTRMGEVVVAVDLSGSISEKELNEFAAELKAIKEDCFPAMLHVLYFTTRIMRHDKFEADDDLVITPSGSGGTEFSHIFQYIDDNDIDPVAVVVLTDLCCGSFGPAPDYPVMWASTERETAPWGEVIMLRERGLRRVAA